jgi:hypothetical protein
MANKKKKTKELNEEFQLNFLKGELESYKTLYENYVEALVEHDITSMAVCEVRVKKRIMNLMKDSSVIKQFLDDVRKSDSKEEDRIKEDRIKENIDYYKKLIGIAEFHINFLPIDVKRKIVKNAIENHNLSHTMLAIKLKESDKK